MAFFSFLNFSVVSTFLSVWREWVERRFQGMIFFF